MKIQVLAERCVYPKDIAEELGIHSKTMSGALERKSTPQRETEAGVSKLSPYQGQIDQMSTSEVWGAQMIWRKLQEACYAGGLYDGTSVYCAQVQPAKSEV